MKILLIGATGRTGRILLKKAIEDKHEVTAIVRDPSKITNANVNIIKGSPYDIDIVKSAVKNCEAVVSTINISRTSDNPWAKLRSPKDLISKSISNAVEAMKENNVKRIISLSALGVGESKKKMPFIFNLIVSSSNLRYAFMDHACQEDILAKSGTNWTVIRLPMLSNEEGEAEIIVNKNDSVKLNRNINRDSVARFLLSILNDEQYFKKMIGISYK